MSKQNKITRSFRLILPVLLAAAAAQAVESLDGRGPACPAGTAVKWIEAAKVFEAGKDKKLPVMVFFHRENCRPCEMLEKNGFSNHEIACYINAKFAPAQVDMEKSPEIAAKHKVSAPPTVWFFTPEGKDIDYFTGYAPPEKLKLILHYIGNGAYKDMSYKEYEKKQGPGK